MRWKNDAGVTREVATGPGWRVAIADLATSGPFSTFPGIDRVLYLLEGPPVTLDAFVVGAALGAESSLDVSAAIEAKGRKVSPPRTPTDAIHLRIKLSDGGWGRIPERRRRRSSSKVPEASILHSRPW